METLDHTEVAHHGNAVRITLKPTHKNRHEPTFVVRALFLLFFFASIGGNIWLLMWVAKHHDPTWIVVVICALLFLGVMAGGLPIWVLFGVKAVLDRRPAVIAFTPTECTVSARWTFRRAELQSIRQDGYRLVFHRHREPPVSVDYPVNSNHQLHWVASYLQQQLDTLAPGSPADIPVELDKLRNR